MLNLHAAVISPPTKAERLVKHSAGHEYVGPSNVEQRASDLELYVLYRCWYLESEDWFCSPCFSRGTQHEERTERLATVLLIFSLFFFRLTSGFTVGHKTDRQDQ